MSYSIIGTGEVGTTLASFFAHAGIEVALANSRGGSAVEPLARKLGKSVVATSLDEALKAEVIFIAVPFMKFRDIASALPDWAGKIVVDVTNAFTLPVEIQMAEFGARPSSEVNAERVPGMDSRAKCNVIFSGSEYFLGCLEAEALTGCVVVAVYDGIEMLPRNEAKIGLSRQRQAQAADGVFDAALLPRGMRIAEEGLHLVTGGKPVMEGELGAVVESDRAVECVGQTSEQPAETSEHGSGGLGGLTEEADQARMPLVNNEDRLAVGAEQQSGRLPSGRLGAGCRPAWNASFWNLW